MTDSVAEFNEIIAQNVRFLRSEQGLSLDDLSAKSNIPKTTLFRIENVTFKKKVQPSYIHDLAQALKVSEDTLTSSNDDFNKKLAELEARVRGRKYSDQDVAFADSLGEMVNNRGPVERIKVYHYRGILSFLRGEYQTALNFYKRAIELAEKSGANEQTIWKLQRNHVEALLRLGRHDELHSITYSLLLEVTDNALRARLLFPLGVSLYKLGQYEPAIERIRQAIDAMMETDRNGVFLARCYEILGTVHRRMNELDKAIANCELALASATLAGDDLCKVYALRVLGEVSLDKDEKEQAKVYFEQALSLAEQNADRKLERVLLEFSLARCEEDVAVSYHKMDEALKKAGEVELSPRDLAEMHELTAKAAFVTGAYTGGKKHYEAAIHGLMAITV